jgi:hypothetical protein
VCKPGKDDEHRHHPKKHFWRGHHHHHHHGHHGHGHGHDCDQPDGHRGHDGDGGQGHDSHSRPARSVAARLVDYRPEGQSGFGLVLVASALALFVTMTVAPRRRRP